MHGAAQAPVEAGGASEDLRQQAVEQIVDRPLLPVACGLLFHHPERVAAEIGLHDPLEIRLVQLVDGRQALGQDLAVTPVATEDVIVHRQEECLAHGGGFLADRKVGGALVDVRDVAVLSLPLDLVQHGLELADEDHVAIEPEGVRRGEYARRQFVGEGAAVVVDRDGAEGEGVRLSDLGGGDDQLLDHGVCAPFGLGGSIIEDCRAAIEGAPDAAPLRRIIAQMTTVDQEFQGEGQLDRTGRDLLQPSSVAVLLPRGVAPLTPLSKNNLTGDILETA